MNVLGNWAALTNEAGAPFVICGHKRQDRRFPHTPTPWHVYLLVQAESSGEVGGLVFCQAYTTA